MKLKKSHASSVRHSYFFTHRVINVWNSLPNSIVLSSTVASFKRKLHSLNCSHNVTFFIFLLRAPVSGGLSLPWCPASTLCFMHLILLYCYFCVTQINWIGLDGSHDEVHN